MAAGCRASNLGPCPTRWAFATAGVEARALYAAVAEAVGSELRGFKPQELSNTVWAFATAGVPTSPSELLLLPSPAPCPSLRRLA